MCGFASLQEWNGLEWKDVGVYDIHHFIYINIIYVIARYLKLLFGLETG